MTFFLHETRYRDLRPIAGQLITICGAGALGANLAEMLARMGMLTIRVIDRDTIEAQNLSTQPWYSQDLGAPKAQVLATALYRAIAAKIDARHIELNESNARQLLKGSLVVVDAFDNLAARRIVAQTAEELGQHCLHLALGSGGDYGCGLWDTSYPALQQQPVATNDACDYPLTRPMAMITAAAGAEVLVAALLTGERRGFEATLRDLHMTQV